MKTKWIIESHILGDVIAETLNKAKIAYVEEMYNLGKGGGDTIMRVYCKYGLDTIRDYSEDETKELSDNLDMMLDDYIEQARIEQKGYLKAQEDARED